MSRKSHPFFQKCTGKFACYRVIRSFRNLIFSPFSHLLFFSFFFFTRSPPRSLTRSAQDMQWFAWAFSSAYPRYSQSAHCSCSSPVCPAGWNAPNLITSSPTSQGRTRFSIWANRWVTDCHGTVTESERFFRIQNWNYQVLKLKCFESSKVLNFKLFENHFKTWEISKLLHVLRHSLNFDWFMLANQFDQ